MLLQALSILFTHPQWIRTKCDCRQGEGDPSGQLYCGSVSAVHIDGTFSQRSCDVQYRESDWHVLWSPVQIFDVVSTLYLKDLRQLFLI